MSTYFSNQARNVIFGDAQLSRALIVALDDLRPFLRFEVFAHRLGSYFLRRPPLRLRHVFKLGEQRFGGG
jgi:hypothetical protein